MFRGKKILFIIAIIAAVIVGLYITGRITGAFRLYSIPTTANQPTINFGDRVISTNLVSPERFDFIIFDYDDPNPHFGKSVYLHRLCGLPGDVVEIRNGRLYLNNVMADSGLNLNYEYIINSKYFLLLNDMFEFNNEEENNSLYQRSKDELIVLLSDEQVKQLAAVNIPCEQIIIAKEEQNELMQKIYNQPWNIDHFGPYRVPRNHYFVLGDNRHRALDSRYTGPIPVEDVVGTVISY